MLALGVAVAGLLALAMTLAWALQAATRNVGWADAVWPFAVAAGGLVAALWPLGGALVPRQILVAALIGAWGLRLGLHLAERAARGREDARHARLRARWGGGFASRMFGRSMAAALAGWVLALGVLVAARNPAPNLGWADLAGVLVLGVAVGGEGLADWQLRQFRADPATRGGVLRRGLWAWSRHPNYFFEALGWFAWPLIALGPSGSPWRGALACAAPVLMGWLLLRVTGIPPLERELLASRGPAFRAYQAATSAFLPLPPRRSGRTLA